MLGFIGGSGLYQIEEISNVEFVTISSSFGKPSDDILLGELDGDKIAFLPRHGRKHTLNPSEINYRANIDVMKQLGVTELVSLSAVGSLEESISPGTFVIVEQFVDKETGEVYKPAGWAKPAKHVRFDMRDERQLKFLLDPKNVGWAGGYLYLR